MSSRSGSVPSHARSTRTGTVVATLVALVVASVALAPSAAADTGPPEVDAAAPAQLAQAAAPTPADTSADSASANSTSADSTSVAAAGTHAPCPDPDDGYPRYGSSGHHDDEQDCPDQPDCPDPDAGTYAAYGSSGHHDDDDEQECPDQPDCPDPDADTYAAYGSSGHHDDDEQECPDQPDCPDPDAYAAYGSSGHHDDDEQECPSPPPPLPAPDADASLVCPATAATVVVRNLGATGAAAVVFTVSAPASTSPLFSSTTDPVAAGAEAVVLVPFAEGETRTITVTGDVVEPSTIAAAGASGGTPHPPHHDFTDKFTLTRSCTAPAGSVSVGCAPAGLAVSVENVGTRAGEFAVDDGVDDAPSDLALTASATTSTVLQPGETLVVSLTVAEGASITVTVTADGVPVAGSPFTFTRTCEDPSATAESACSARGAQITLTNTGPEASTLEVRQDGTPIRTLTVGAGQTVVIVVPMVEDQVSVFAVTGAGFDSGPMPVVVDCVQIATATAVARPAIEVLGASATRLAFTGGAGVGLAVPGALMTATGTLALVASKRRRRMRDGR